jgi:hypothetical protein
MAPRILQAAYAQCVMNTCKAKCAIPDETMLDDWAGVLQNKIQTKLKWMLSNWLTPVRI